MKYNNTGDEVEAFMKSLISCYFTPKRFWILKNVNNLNTIEYNIVLLLLTLFTFSIPRIPLMREYFALQCGITLINDMTLATLATHDGSSIRHANTMKNKVTCELIVLIFQWLWRREFGY